MTDVSTLEIAHPITGEVSAAPGMSLDLPADMAFSAWRALGEKLCGASRVVNWWIGDWWAFGGSRYGERAKAAAEGLFGRDFQALADCAMVSRKFETSRRREVLSFTHHREVASLPTAEADALLDQAEEQEWSTRELRQAVNQRRTPVGTPPSSDTCTVDDLAKLAGRQYGCIYADPPWLYDNQGTRAATGNHYGGLTVDELCALPVGDLAAPDAHLHLWTTNAFLFECPRIFKAWGFEFRSTLVWVKPQMGIGNYWRNSHEFLLTAIRGDAKRFNDRSLMSWLQCDRSAHSAKPELVRTMVERASPGPYLEMFGRLPAPRWTVWGNQIRRDLLLHDVEAL